VIKHFIIKMACPNIRKTSQLLPLSTKPSNSAEER